MEIALVAFMMALKKTIKSPASKAKAKDIVIHLIEDIKMLFADDQDVQSA